MKVLFARTLVKFILNYKHKIAGNFEVSLKENFKVENFLTLERLNDSSTGLFINGLKAYFNKRQAIVKKQKGINSRLDLSLMVVM